MTTNEKYMGKLEGKIALITGGNSGIGLATAKQFVNEGAYVFITGRRDPELAPAVKEIGRNVTGVQGDVSNLADLDRLFAQIKREKGKLDSIAGLRPDGRLVLMGFENKPLAVHPGDLIMRRIRILGSQQNDREYLHEALQIAASGKVKVMTETYSLDEITKAYERVADGKVRFRAVITTSN
jgi:D-arabinose 1-dehydrogenase-like Zn-dependent alcohol dehydrogenase